MQGESQKKEEEDQRAIKPPKLSQYSSSDDEEDEEEEEDKEEEKEADIIPTPQEEIKQRKQIASMNYYMHMELIMNMKLKKYNSR